MTTTPSTNDLTRQQLEELDALLQRMLAAPTITEDRKPRPLPADVAPPLPPTGEALTENWRLDRPAPKVPHLDLPAPVAPETVVASATVKVPYALGREPADHMLMPPTMHVPAPLGLETEDVNPADVTDDDLPTLSGFKLPEVPVTPSQAYSPPPVVEMVPLQAQPSPVAELPQFGRLNIADLKQPPLPPETPSESAAVEPAANEGLSPVMWPVFAVNWVAEECLKLFGGESLTKPAAKWAMGVAGILMMVGAAVWTLHGFGIVTLPIK